MTVFEDNTACLLVLGGTATKELRHVARTHCISIAFLQPAIAVCNIECKYIESALNRSDPFTKLFTNQQKWVDVLQLLNIW